MSEDAIFRAIYDIQARIGGIENTLIAFGVKQEDQCKAALHQKSETEDLDGKFYSLEEQLEEQKKNLEEFKLDVFNHLDRVHKELVNEKNYRVVHEEQLRNLTETDKEIRERLNVYCETLNNNISNISRDVREEIKNAISNQPKPKIPSDNEITSAIHLKIEPVSIDAKNACLRSANNDMRLGIAEKKIEQIFLLIQRHTLNQ